MNIPKGVWHTLESLESGSVFFECKEGPFVAHEVDGILDLLQICRTLGMGGPTGYLYSQKEMNQIRDLVKKYNLYLFSDEVYRMLTFQQLFMACDGKSGNLVYLRMVVAEQLRFQL